jgi:hypothetical protein
MSFSATRRIPRLEHGAHAAAADATHHAIPLGDDVVGLGLGGLVGRVVVLFRAAASDHEPRHGGAARVALAEVGAHDFRFVAVELSLGELDERGRIRTLVRLGGGEHDQPSSIR